MSLRQTTYAAADPWPARLGFASMMAFGVPLLGAEFGGYVGLHPRVLSYAASALVILVALSGRYRAGVHSRMATSVHIALGLFALGVAVSLPYERALWVLEDGMRISTYPGFKFTRVLLIAVPTIATAIAAYPLARKRGFVNGLVVAAVLLAGVASVELLAYRHLLASGNYSDWSAFADESAFSTISMSMVFLFALVAVQSWAARVATRRAVLIAVGVSAWCLFAAFLLAQRTTMGLGILFSGVTLLRFVRRPAIARVVWLGIAVGVVFMVLGFSADETSGSLDKYAAQVARVESLLSGGDNSTNYRVEMWGFAFERTIFNPLGHGFGSFPAHYREQFYPHNVLAEAGFELGIVGAAGVVWMVVISVAVMLRGFRSRDGVYGFALFAALMWVMKAGDFAGFGNWVFWLYLAIGGSLRRIGGGP